MVSNHVLLNSATIVSAIWEYKNAFVSRTDRLRPHRVHAIFLRIFVTENTWPTKYRPAQTSILLHVKSIDEKKLVSGSRPLAPFANKTYIRRKFIFYHTLWFWLKINLPRSTGCYWTKSFRWPPDYSEKRLESITQNIFIAA